MLVNWDNMKLSFNRVLNNIMNHNNEKLPWILILGGSAILIIRLIVVLFSSLSVIDWLAIIIVISGLILLIMNNKSWSIHSPINKIISIDVISFIPIAILFKTSSGIPHSVGWLNRYFVFLCVFLSICLLFQGLIFCLLYFAV